MCAMLPCHVVCLLYPNHVTSVCIYDLCSFKQAEEDAESPRFCVEGLF